MGGGGRRGVGRRDCFIRLDLYITSNHYEIRTSNHKKINCLEKKKNETPIVKKNELADVKKEERVFAEVKRNILISVLEYKEKYFSNFLV